MIIGETVTARNVEVEYSSPSFIVTGRWQYTPAALRAPMGLLKQYYMYMSRQVYVKVKKRISKNPTEPGTALKVNIFVIEQGEQTTDVGTSP